jgi:hypothetical protein
VRGREKADVAWARMRYSPETTGTSLSSGEIALLQEEREGRCPGERAAQRSKIFFGSVERDLL